MKSLALLSTPAAHRRNLFFAAVWLLAFVFCAVFSARQLLYTKPFHSNLLELLPRDERNPVLHDLSLLLASRFQDRLLVLIAARDKDLGLSQAQDLKARLLHTNQLQEDQTSDGLQQQLQALYRPYSQQLLSAETRLWLERHSPEQLAEQAYGDLFNPIAMPRPYGFAEDPFNLGGRWLTSLAPAVKLQEYQGFPIVEARGEQWLLVSARLRQSPFDPEVQEYVTGVLAAFRSSWPDAQLLTSGMIFHAAAGTEQATLEINTVGLGSMLGIVAMVLWVFRSPVPLGAVLLTMTSAYFLALTVSLLVFGRIHIITLAFGSTLLGVAGDYVLHFLMGSQREGGGLIARHELRFAMAIGALTGIGAYLLQFTTPFPGLQQMAIFCASGIFGAWMTVLALGPFYRPRPAGGAALSSLPAPLRAATSFFRVGLGLYQPLWCHPKSVTLCLAALTVVAMAVVVRGGANDSVLNLNTSPKALLVSEQQVQGILLQPSVSRFFFVEAASAEELLIRAQALSERLAQADQSGWRWQGLTQYLPATARQLADRQLVFAKLYGERGALAQLCAKLTTQCQAPRLADTVLTPAEFTASSLGQLAPPMIPKDDTWYSVVTLVSPASDQTLAELTASLPGVKLINQTDDLSQLLGRYRWSVCSVLAVTLVLLAAGLLVRYRRRAWRLLLPLLVAMVFALGSAAIDGITLFHVMALLLVIGIGLDTAVFYTEGGFNPESWLASSLACGTSILAFGLLSLSAVPVLHQFGLIILVGILTCWLLTPLFFAPTRVAAHPLINEEDK